MTIAETRKSRPVRFRSICLLLLGLVAGTGAAQYQPAAGSDSLYSLLGAWGPAQSLLPGDIGGAWSANPAEAARSAVPEVSLSWLALADSAGLQGFAGVLSGSTGLQVADVAAALTVLSSPDPFSDLGRGLGLRALAAKSLGESLRLGVAAQLLGGTGSAGFGIGVSADLGASLELGPRLRVDAGVLGVGVPWRPSGAGAAPPVFSPSIGAHYTILDSEILDIAASGGLRFPQFSGLIASVGTVLRLDEWLVLSLDAATDVSARISGAPARPVIPGISLALELPAGSGRRARTEASLQPFLGDGSFATGGRIGLRLRDPAGAEPSVEVSLASGPVVSPNGDGTLDAAAWDFAADDPDGDIIGYEIRIEPVAGGDPLVRERFRVSELEITDVASFLSALAETRARASVPTEYRWFGEGSDGPAPDGSYRVVLEVEDAAGNRVSEDGPPVRLDRQPPSVRVAAESLRFSPDGDGVSDRLQLDLEASPESRWEWEISDAQGSAVRTGSFAGAGAGSLVWDGTTDDGITAANGVYSFRISATDAGGNTGTAVLRNIVLEASIPEPILTIDRPAISPNGDGLADQVRLGWDAPGGVDTRWTLLLSSAAGERVLREGSGRPAGELVFPEDPADALAEGDIVFRLRVEYPNGNRSTGQSAPVTVDLSPPQARVSLEQDLFSPDGDGIRDNLLILHEAGAQTRWVGEVRSESDEVVRTFTWSGFPERRFTWDGSLEDGQGFVPDGTYRYRITATDIAGNRGFSNTVRFQVDTRVAGAAVQVTPAVFSPNRDGERDQTRFLIRLENADLAQWRLDIIGQADSPVRSFAGSGVPPAEIPWDGTSTAGLRVLEGTYRAVFAGSLPDGSTVSAESTGVTLDLSPPQADLAILESPVSPNGDGRRDTVRYRFTPTGSDDWTLFFRQGGNSVPIPTAGSGVNQWDARDPQGNPVADGSWELVAVGVDPAGNRAELSGGTVVIDRRVPQGFLTASAQAISPNSDGISDELDFSATVVPEDGLSSWQFALLDEAGETVWTRDGTDLPAGQLSIAWPESVRADGLYRPILSLAWEKGDRLALETPPIRVDSSPPEVSLELGPLPFGPDGDGTADLLTMRISARDEAAIAGWRLEIVDRNGRFFRDFAGRGTPPASLEWNGRAADGELVLSAEEYGYELTVADELGNRRTVTGRIPIDILVIRDGDQLRVQIPSITFTPNSPDLILDPADPRGAQNLAVLQRLVEVFDRYPSYRIEIEGHAVNLTGTAREEDEILVPLSLARAQRVATALVERGMADRRVSAIGRGGQDPVVPHSDVEQRWKNRRVEFILIR